MKTIFQKIIDREIPAEFIHEDEHCIAIHDINPQAPVHVLIIPKKCILRLSAATAADQTLLGHLLLAAAVVARKLGVDENGYRLVINNGRYGGETVAHMHLHLLGRRQMGWPPG